MRVPKLQFYRNAERTIVSACFATIPNCTFDLWMYESSPDFSLPDVASAQYSDRFCFEFTNERTLPEGSLELEHKVSSIDEIILKTTLTPFSEGVDIVVKPVILDSGVKDTIALPVPNLCFQTVNAEAFKSDPNNYQEFVGRCFIFTENGPVFLDATQRMKNAVKFSEDDPRNNPPKAQLYTALSRDVPPTSKMFGAGHSPDKFVTPVIGIVSRDKKHLIAVATRNADLMWQAYVDCVHNNPIWEPMDGPIEERMLHTRIIFMENNLDSLAQKVQEDSHGKSCQLFKESP